MAVIPNSPVLLLTGEFLYIISPMKNSRKGGHHGCLANYYYQELSRKDLMKNYHGGDNSILIIMEIRIMCNNYCKP